MRLDPFLAPDDPQPADEKHFTESDIQDALLEKKNALKFTDEELAGLLKYSAISNERAGS